MAKINKKELLSKLKKDFKNAEVHHDVEVKNIERRRAEFNGEPYGNERKGKSSIVSKDIKRQGAWQHAAIVDPFVSSTDIIKCSPVTWEDKESARQNELLLNTQFCRQFDRYNFMTNAVKLLDIEGTVVIQTGWEYEDKEVDVEAETITVDEYGNEYIEYVETTETVVLVNKPTAKICRNEDIYIDPTCMGDMDNCQFVVYRYETDLSTLKQDGRYKNLDKIQVDSEDANAHDDYEAAGSEISTFLFEDDPRKKIVVYEYWGNYDINNDGIAEPIVCAWVGDTVIRLQDNPYPDKKPPFIVVPFNSIPFEIYGEANADLISDNQKVKTAILRGFIDNMAQSTNGQVGISKQALDAGNRKKFVAGENFEYNGQNPGIWQGQYNQIPGSAFDMLGLMNNEIESLTGIKSFSGGITGASLGSTATAARGAMDATSTRRLNIVRNIAENLIKPLMRKWIAYNAEFLSDEEVIRITNEEYIEIRRDDLEGKIDIEITVATQEDNAAKSQELAFLLQTMGNTMPFEMTQLVLAEIVKLSKMPALEKKIKEFQPQPDPMQQQLQELELAKLQKELQMLDVQIQKTVSEAQENEGDTQEKMAKARVEMAKAMKLENEARLAGERADMESLKFLKADNQIDEQTRLEELQLKHQLEMQKKQYDTEVSMAQMMLQARQGGANEQIGVPR
jgi:hypothetical protein